MTNFDTVRAITANIHKALAGQGAKFPGRAYEDVKSIPASLMPCAEIQYAGEAFENTYGQRPLYAQAQFEIKIVLNERDTNDLAAAQQKWVHRIREALTVNALNANELSADKYVSSVTTKGVDVQNHDSLSVLVYRVAVRYREV